MSIIAFVAPADEDVRYEYSTSISDLIGAVKSFHYIVATEDLADYKYLCEVHNYPGSDVIILNTPETAEEIGILSSLDLLQAKYAPRGRNSMQGQKIAEEKYRIFIKVPDNALDTWYIIDGVLVDLKEYEYWISNLMEKGLPPRSQEEIEHERLKKIEDDERVANLRPVEIGKVAVIRLYDTINYNVVVLTLDLNNTTVKQLRQAIAGTLGAPPAGVPMASTNAFTIDQVLDRVKSRGINSAVNFDSNNRFRSVLTGRKHGQNPPVGVDPSQRSTISDGQRLADIKGNVIVYAHVHDFPKETFLSKLKEIGIEAVIDILIG